MSAAVTLPVLQTLSNSALSCFRRCAREYKYRYVTLRRPRQKSEALRFGSLLHLGLNAWWRCSGEASEKLAAAVEAMRADDADEWDLVRAEELMLGYTARWGDEGYETVAVEHEFDVPLVNPESGRASKTYRVRGAIDAIARRDGKLFQIEHKSTSRDITPGADYWRKVSALDTQVSTYQAAMKVSGLNVHETLYDVIRKVALRPLKATPIESRKYKANGVLYANQRENDETAEEYRLRVREAIAEDPSRYFARGPVVRLERDVEEHAADTWMTATMLRISENQNTWPRNPGSCERFGSFCSYFEACSGNASIDDESLFYTADRPHEELSVKEV